MKIVGPEEWSKINALKKTDDADNDITSKHFVLVDSSQYEDEALPIRFVKDFMNKEIVPLVEEIVPDEGADLYGISRLGAFIGAVSYSLGVAIDNEGNVNGVFTEGYGGGTPNISLGGYTSHMDVNTNQDLAGGGLDIGASVLWFSLDFTPAITDKYDAFNGYTVNIAWSLNIIPVEAHFLLT